MHNITLIREVIYTVQKLKFNFIHFTQSTIKCVRNARQVIIVPIYDINTIQ